MQRTRSFLISGILLALLAGTFLTSGSARAASSAPKITCKQWNYVTSPNPSTSYNVLVGVTAISSTDVWAVGSEDNSSSTTLTLAEHYDGTQWNVVSTPSPAGTQGAYLLGVAAVSTSDVWAAGYYFDSNYIAHTLIEHWNGTAWSIIPSPDSGTNGDQLNGVAAISATDIWAAGSYQNSNYIDYTLVEHWNGTSWKIVTSPNVTGQSNILSSIASISSKAVWAVGSSNNLSTLVEKWNGTAWKIVASPNVTGQSNILNSIVAISGKAIWAAGDLFNTTNGQYSTLIEKWNGTAWSIIPSPTPSSTYILTLRGMAAISNNSIWAVGWYQNIQGYSSALIEHWNGTGWNIVSGSKAGSQQNELFGITRIPGTSTLWATGLLFANSGDQTLTEYYC
jgi:hypothetical protein